ITRKSSPNFKVLDFDEKLLEVDFKSTPVADIINDIGTELKIDIFTATPLQGAGSITFKTKSITFDELLVKIFESQTIHNQVIQTNNNTPISRVNQNQSNNNPSVSPQLFTFKKDGDIYFFGTENQLSVRDVEIV